MFSPISVLLILSILVSCCYCFVPYRTNSIALRNMERQRDCSQLQHRSFGNFQDALQMSQIPESSLSKIGEKAEKIEFPDYVWKLLMLAVCIIWSTNFSVIKLILYSVPDGLLEPSLYLSIRFSIAAVLLSPLLVGKYKNKDLTLNGLLLGAAIFVGYLGQSLGLEVSTADKSAFFCSLHVVFVPLVNQLLTKTFKLQTWVAVAFSVIGVALIELKGSVQPEIGDLLLVLQPIGFGSGYLLLERLIKKYPDEARAITAYKITGVAICSLIWTFFNGTTFDDLAPLVDNSTAISGLLYTSVVTTSFAIWLQSIVFKRVPATDASIILTSEPLWAALFASGTKQTLYFWYPRFHQSFSLVLLGETITNPELLGGGIIIFGCLINELNLIEKFRATFDRKVAE